MSTSNFTATDEGITITRPEGWTDERWREAKDACNARWAEALDAVGVRDDESRVVDRAACPDCGGSGFIVADMDADGNGHWASCSCEPTRACGPINCAPFCIDGDGHPDEGWREDQWCHGAALSISLPPYRLSSTNPYDPCGLYADRLDVLPVRRWEAGEEHDYVKVFQDGPDSELLLTAEQALELSANLMLVVHELHSGDRDEVAALR